MIENKKGECLTRPTSEAAKARNMEKSTQKGVDDE